MKNILTEALVNSATNASFIFSYTNSAKLRIMRFIGRKNELHTLNTEYNRNSSFVVIFSYTNSAKLKGHSTTATKSLK